MDDEAVPTFNEIASAFAAGLARWHPDAKFILVLQPDPGDMPLVSYNGSKSAAHELILDGAIVLLQPGHKSRRIPLP